MVLKLIFCIGIAAFDNFACYGNVYNGYEVYEVPLLSAKITEENFLKFLNNPPSKNIEIIHHDPFKGSVHVLVSPSMKKEFLSTLKDKKLKSKVIIKDVGRLIKPSYQLRMEDVNLNRNRLFDHYMTFHEINAFVNMKLRRFPNKIRVENIGSSIEGENISIVIITENVRSMEDKPVIFIEAGIHAREWISVSTAVYFIDKLSKTPTYTRDVEWRIIPVANPDGYKFTFGNQNNRLWRKNRRTFPDTHCKGVDLNRNFDFYWGRDGSTFNKCEDEYVGEGPFSEPESRAIRDTILEIQNRMKVFVSFHSYGQFILHPPGILSVNIPEELKQKLTFLGNEMADIIFQETSKRYLVGDPATLMYEAPGSSMDFTMFNAGIPISFSFELRDKGQHGFLLPEEQIIPTAEEIWAAVIVLYVEETIEMSRRMNIDPRQESISDDGLHPATKKLEMSSRRSVIPRQESISDDGLHPETNDANEISIPFNFVHSALTSLLNDWLSCLWDNDVNKLLDNFFIGNDVD